MPLPVRIFETSDVVLKDRTAERRARNERHWAAAYMGNTSGLEVTHGLMDVVLQKLKMSFSSEDKTKRDAYYLEPLEDEPTYFPGRVAAIWVRIGGGEAQRVGEFGVLHPTVLEKFELK